MVSSFLSPFSLLIADNWEGIPDFQTQHHKHGDNKGTLQGIERTWTKNGMNTCMTVISPTGHHGTIGKHHWDTQRRWGIWNEIWNMGSTMTRALANTNWVSTYLCVCMSLSISLSVHMWDFPGIYSRCRLVALEGCFSTKDFKGGQFSNSIKECHHVQTTFFLCLLATEVGVLGGMHLGWGWPQGQLGLSQHGWYTPLREGQPVSSSTFWVRVGESILVGWDPLIFVATPFHVFLFVSDEMQYVELCRPGCCCLKPRPSVVNYG